LLSLVCRLIVIKKLIDENYKVSIVLTKADSLTEEEEAEFIQVIAHELGNNIAIIPVCSEHKKTRGGEIIPFGKEIVEKQSLIDLVDSLVLRIPFYCKQDIFIFYIQWLIFLLIGNTMKNTMLRKGLTIF
jgi:hypothetical protein